MTVFYSEIELQKIHEIRLRLNQVGLKATTARIFVLKAIMDAGTPVTHSEITSVTKKLGYNKATVYRNLTDLCDADLITKSKTSGKSNRFLLASPSG